MTTHFATIRDLASVVVTQWPKTVAAMNAIGSHILQATCPGQDRIETICNIAYHAAFYTEEARPFTARLVYCPDDLLAALQTGGHYSSIPFLAPRPFSVKELVRLAPALDASHSAVVLTDDIASGQLR